MQHTLELITDVSHGAAMLGNSTGPTTSLGLGVRSPRGAYSGPSCYLAYQELDTEEPGLTVVFIHTLEEYGPIGLRLEQRDKAPDLVTDGFDSIEEFSIHCDPHEFGLRCTFDLDSVPNPIDPILIPAGTPDTEFRIRVSAAGLEDFIALDVPCIDWDTEPYEKYLVQAWPAPMTEPRLIKRTATVSTWLAKRYSLDDVGEWLDTDTGTGA